MDRKKVSSSSIRSVGYDERNRVLEVEFNDGRVNQYSGVSAEVHRRLMVSAVHSAYIAGRGIRIRLGRNEIRKVKYFAS